MRLGRPCYDSNQLQESQVKLFALCLAQAHAWVAAWPIAEARARAALQVSSGRLDASMATHDSVRWEAGQACGLLTPDSVLVQRVSGEGGLAEASGGAHCSAPDPLQGDAPGGAWAYGAQDADWEGLVQRLVCASSSSGDLAALGLASAHLVGITRVHNDGLAALCAPTRRGHCPGSAALLCEGASAVKMLGSILGSAGHFHFHIHANATSA